MKRLLSFSLAFLLFAIAMPVRAHTANGSVTVSARHATLYEPVTDTFLYDKDGDTPAPMASTTKIMTAYVACMRGDLTDRVVIPKDACGIEGSSLYLEAGETLTLHDLLWGVLLQSANDAATAVAIHMAGSVSDFARLMNEEAGRLGLQNTHFTNPHGLDDPDHYTTAKDLARLAAAALELPVFREMVASRKHTIPRGDEGDIRVLVNHNKLLHLYPDSAGVKTGFTKKSGRCLVGAAERDGLTLISVTLDAPNDWNDHMRLLDMGFRQVQNQKLWEAGELRYTVPSLNVPGTTVVCTNSEAVYAVLKTGAEEPTLRVSLPHYIPTPQKNGKVVGTLTVYQDGRAVGSAPLAVYEIQTSR